jgi:hypothetical protein
MPQYISVSRRTDIPSFYANDFFMAWLKGSITYNGGYGRLYTVSLDPEDVMGYIFWSKDFSPLINHPLFERLIEVNNAVFHFTINDCRELEPNVSPVEERLATLYRLCDIVGPQRVFWRFDPICKYITSTGEIRTNEKAFFKILPHVKKAGIERCCFSFMTFYKKLNNRGLAFVEFTLEQKIGIAGNMASSCTEYGMQLYNCCNAEIPRIIPGIKPASCIDDGILRETDRFGVHKQIKLKPVRKGCGCFDSRDIGSYIQKCPHKCLYCYANPLS